MLVKKTKMGSVNLRLHNSIIDFDQHNYLLCIVIIAKNEEKFIEKCIKSCLESIEEIVNSKIILVDSISSDRTIELAKKFDITIYKLTNTELLSPAASKYIGYIYSKSKYIFFIDGDMIIDKDWFKFAIPFLQEHPKIVGIGGLNPDMSEEKLEEYLQSKLFKNNIEINFIEVLNGAGLFNRESLDIAGCYNPFLRGGEEAELSFRLRNVGFKLVRADTHMICHLGIVKYRGVTYGRIKYYRGIGQIFRLYINTKYRFSVFQYYIWNVLQISYVSLNILFLILSLRSYHFFIIFILSNVSLLMATLLYRKKIDLSIISYIQYYLKGFNIIYGFINGCKKADDYPRKIIVIKK